MENHTKNKLQKAANSIGGVHPDWDPLTSFRWGFKEGAKWLSENMWISVKEALPIDEGTKVICKMKSNGELVSGYIYLNNGVPTIETDPAFEFQDYENYEVTHWMPIPEFKKGE